MTAIAVLDIGKSNTKLSVVSGNTGRLLFSQTTETQVRKSPYYPHIDTDSLWQWMLESLKQAQSSTNLDFIVTTAHGATAALIDQNELVLPILDYEHDGPDELSAEYNQLCDRFDQTYSPELPHGLNLGRQLYWQRKRFPDAFARAHHLLPYPQYWTWRLTGQAISEVTTIGSHTDLWFPQSKQWSRFAQEQGFAQLAPPMRKASEIAGTIKPELARECGLSESCQVLVGIHDSNASLIPYLQQRSEPFTVLSTGTWVIIFAIGAALEQLNPARDCAANVNIYSNPIACARFMGGREFAAVASDTRRSGSLDDLQNILDSDTYAWPCFTREGGPYPGMRGRIESSHALSAEEQYALASVYVALLSDVSLSLCGSIGDIVVEGSFARNELFLQSLSVLRSDQPVLASSDNTGTTLGAAMLAEPSISPPVTELKKMSNQSLAASLLDYRSRWHQQLTTDGAP